MYKRDIPHLPRIISRKHFVKEIFDLGLRLEYGYDTLITAVQIGDRFVSYEGERVPYTSYKKKYRKKLSKEQIDLITDLVPQVYSRELAHVAFAISSNCIEDWGYSIEDAAVELNNGYVYKMQWEVCMMHNFYIPSENFLTHLFSLIDYEKYTIRGKQSPPLGPIQDLSGSFWDLTRHICMDETLLYASTQTIIISIIILAKNNRLRARTDYRKRIFQNIMIQTSQEYEIPLCDLLQAYIEYKSSNRIS